MKTIGLIGGMSWRFTRTYYDLLNEMVVTRLDSANFVSVFQWARPAPVWRL